MPEIPDRINGEIIEAAHINTNRDRTIQRYTSAGNRDSLVPLPVDGDTAWLSDEDVLTVYTGSAWFKVAMGAATSDVADVPITEAAGVDDTIRTVDLPAPTGGTWLYNAGGFIDAAVGANTVVYTMRLFAGGSQLQATQVEVTGDGRIPFSLTGLGSGQGSLTVARDFDVAGIQSVGQAVVLATRAG